MPDWAVALLSVVIGAFVGPAAVELFSSFRERRERQRKIWERDMQKLEQLESNASDLTISTTLYRGEDNQADVIIAQLTVMRRLGYSFRPYPGFSDDVDILHELAIARMDATEELSVDQKRRLQNELMKRVYRVLRKANDALEPPPIKSPIEIVFDWTKKHIKSRFGLVLQFMRARLYGGAGPDGGRR